MEKMSAAGFVKTLEAIGMIKIIQRKKIPGQMLEYGEISDFMWDGASRTLCGSEEYEPTAFFFSNDTYTMANLGPLFSGDEDDQQKGKEMAAFAMRTIAKEVNAQAFSFVSGAWTRFLSNKGDEAWREKEEIERNGGLANDPKRIEVLIVSIETKRSAGIEFACVKRGAEGLVTEVNRMRDRDLSGNQIAMCGGRFANILGSSQAVN